MKVKAKQDGFYKIYRKAGEEFSTDGADLPFWCESLEAVKSASMASAKTSATNSTSATASTSKK